MYYEIPLEMKRFWNEVITVVLYILGDFRIIVVNHWHRKDFSNDTSFKLCMDVNGKIRNKINKEIDALIFDSTIFGS